MTPVDRGGVAGRVDRADPKEGTVSRSRRLKAVVVAALAMLGAPLLFGAFSAHAQQGAVQAQVKPTVTAALTPPGFGGAGDGPAPLALGDEPVQRQAPTQAPTPIPTQAVPVAGPGEMPVEAGGHEPLPSLTEPGVLEGVPDASAAQRDEEVMPAQGQALPSPAGAPAAGNAPVGGAFVISPESVPLGPQSVGLSVQVFAPSTMNLNREATVTIVVKNTAAKDASGVVVRDQLPEGVEFVSSQPETAAPAGGLVSWYMQVIPGNTERQIKMVLKPTVKGSQDHTATVQIVTGSRARTVVLQPELKVEQTVNRTNVLKGQQVQFEVSLTNTGDGPARNVMVEAELSEGLSHRTEGRILRLEVKEIPPRQTLKLDPLIVEAVGGGEQNCTVLATSDDVVSDPALSKNVKAVTIVEPRLLLELTGSELRYTDSDGEYTLTVTNPGTAPAMDVRVSATLLGDGRPYVPAGAAWDAGTRKMTWTIPEIEPGGGTKTYSFRVRLGGLGIFKVDGEAIGRGGLRDFKSVSTSVEGNADVELNVTADMRFLDVGQDNVFRITLRNLGTKEARKVQVSVLLSDTMEAVETAGTDQNAIRDTKKVQIAWPEIDRIPPGAEKVLGIKAKAKAPGLGTCRVYVSHDDLKDFGGARLEKVAHSKITGTVGSAPTQPPK